MNDYQQGYRDALIDVSNGADKSKNGVSLHYWKALDDIQSTIRLMLDKALFPETSKNPELRNTGR